MPKRLETTALLGSHLLSTKYEAPRLVQLVPSDMGPVVAKQIFKPDTLKIILLLDHLEIKDTPFVGPF